MIDDPDAPRAPSQAEQFLIDFHDARPGLTAKAFGSLPVVCDGRAYASSYELLAEAVPRVAAPMAVLDLACGDGWLLSLLAARAQPGLTLAGIDMSAAELAAARARLGDSVALRQAMAQQLPAASGSFDCVLCHMALMLMDSLDQVMAEIRRVLRGPGSRFAAVLGAAPPPSVALTAFIDAVKRRPRSPHLSAVQLGDRRLRSREGILEALTPSFRDIAVADVQLSQRLTPDQAWLWFLDMYDLYLLDDADRRIVEQDFRAAVDPACGPAGTLDFPQTLRYVCAAAA